MKPPQVSVYRTLVLWFLSLLQNIDCGYSLEPHRRGGSNVYPQSMFCAKVYPLEPHFYIEKMGVAGVYLFFLFLLQNIDCGYSLEPPRRGGSNVCPQFMF